MYRVLIIFILGISCGQQTANISPQLQQASEVQNQALKAYWEISQTYDDTSCKEALSDLDRLRNKMVDIPGVLHDHKYCNGKHRSSDIKLSDEEMLAVQQEWHDSIFVKIKAYKDCLAGQ